MTQSVAAALLATEPPWQKQPEKQVQESGYPVYMSPRRLDEAKCALLRPKIINENEEKNGVGPV